MMTTNRDIYNFLYPLREFGGVFNESTIGSLRARSLPCYVVCNLASEGDPGTHWVSLALEADKAVFFDSFGAACKSDGMKRLLVERGYKSYTYNMYPLQHSLSVSCGEFCIGYVLSQKAGWHLSQYVGLFKYRSRVNDQIIIDVVDILSKQYLNK